MEDKATEQRTSRIKNWLKNRENLAFLGILLFAIAIRLYYFVLTKDQPLWWDEAGYMAAAKTYAGMGHYVLESIRLPGFSIFVSLFYMIGITSEPLLRFLVLLIPSIVLIMLTYSMLKEMYSDRRIAIISSLILTVLWENLFYSNRFQTENLALIFEFLAIFVFFKVYMKKQDWCYIKPKWSLLLVAAFSVISILFRPGNLVFIPALIAFFLIVNTNKIVTNKKLKIGFVIGVIAAVAAFFFSLKYIPKIPMLAAYYAPQNPIAWIDFTFFYGIYQSTISWVPSLFFYAFLFGLAIFVIGFVMDYKKIKHFKDNSEEFDFKSDIFSILSILSLLFIFMFMIRSYNGFEYRWFFPLLPGLLAFTSEGIITFSQYIGSFLDSKSIKTALIVIIVVLGLFTQWSHADNITKIKISSYQAVKDSGLWLKENSNPDDIIMSASVPQHSFYTERSVEDFHNELDDTENGFDKQVAELKPKYVVLSVFEPGFTPQWAYSWPQKHNDTVKPVVAYALDETNQQTALVVYEIFYENETKTNINLSA